MSLIHTFIPSFPYNYNYNRTGQKNADGVGISVMSNKTYEEEFALELDNKKKYKGDTEILKSKKVKSAAARLDIRSKMKSDKFCK